MKHIIMKETEENLNNWSWLIQIIVIVIIHHYKITSCLNEAARCLTKTVELVQKYWYI